MHALPALKHAALAAFETEDGPGDMVGFFSIIDPQSVLELVEISGTRITDEALQALYHVPAKLERAQIRSARLIPPACPTP